MFQMVLLFSVLFTCIIVVVHHSTYMHSNKGGGHKSCVLFYLWNERGFYILRIMLLCPPPVKIYSLAYWSARNPFSPIWKKAPNTISRMPVHTERSFICWTDLVFFSPKKSRARNFIVRKEGLLRKWGKANGQKLSGFISEGFRMYY